MKAAQRALANQQEGVDNDGGAVGFASDDQARIGNAAVAERIRAQQALSRGGEAGDDETTTPTTAQTTGSTASEDSSAEVHYTLASGVVLPSDIAAKVKSIADKYHEKTQKNLVVTSGTRTASRQAAAMYTKLEGGDQLGDYANTTAAAEIKKAYDDGKSAGKSQSEIVASMTTVINDQISKGIYISKHLQAGAVDIRSHDMSADDKKAFEEACSGYTTPLLETTPPHYHLQF